MTLLRLRRVSLLTTVLMVSVFSLGADEADMVRFRNLLERASFPENDEALLMFTAIESVAGMEDPQFEWLMGLDNVDRVAPGRFGLLTAAKGL